MEAANSSVPLACSADSSTGELTEFDKEIFPLLDFDQLLERGLSTLELEMEATTQMVKVANDDKSASSTSIFDVMVET